MAVSQQQSTLWFHIYLHQDRYEFVLVCLLVGLSLSSIN